MLKRIGKITWALAILVPCLGALAAAQNRDVPVTTTIEDFEQAIAPTLQIQSDGGVYQNSRDLGSVIQSGGDWALTTNTRFSTRGVKLDFSQPVPGSGPSGSAPIAPPPGTYKARLITKCHVYGNNLLELVDGQIVPCPLHIAFNIGSDTYGIEMNPLTGVSVYPDTNYVNVTCIGPSPGSPCNQWTIEPTGAFLAPDGTLKKRNRAHFYKTVTSKGKTIETDLGDFYFSFQIQMTKQ